MISRHYVFEVRVEFPHEVEIAGLRKETLRFGGVVFHRSWLPNPGVAYTHALAHAHQQVLQHTNVTEVDPQQLSVVKFERII